MAITTTRRGLIFETQGSVRELKVSKENGLMSLSGIFGECGVRNRNNRVYEKSNYGAMISDFQKRIAEDGGVPGTLEHENSLYVNLENVSHKVVDIQMDENGVITGTIQLLNTPKGKIAQAIVEGGLPLFISSRASGQVDKNGNVTLEKLSTYDIVSQPGVASAKLHLNESQILESLGDDCCLITEKTTPEEPDNDNKIDKMNEDNKKDEIIRSLEERIQELDEQIDQLNERINGMEEYNDNFRRSEQPQLDLKALCEGIQKWIVEEYSPELQNWLENEFAPAHEPVIDEHLEERVNDLLEDQKKNLLEQVNEMMIHKFAPAIQEWMVQEYAPGVQDWITEKVAPAIQEWVIQEFAPTLESWMNEQYSEDLQGKILAQVSESLKEDKQSKMQAITDVLGLLESMSAPAKPAYPGKMLVENASNAEPIYIREMPEEARVRYNMASESVKENIARRAQIYDFSKEGAIQHFWESVSFQEPVLPVNPLSDLDKIVDQQERAIRAAFRRHRNNVL